MATNYTQLQKALNTLGCAPQLKLTGLNDDQTQAAVKAFQTISGISPVDGIVGPVTGTIIAHKLNPNGIPIALACILDCTDWDMPAGGWVMSKNCINYRFFYQPIYPGGGYGALSQFNQELSCGHVQVPVDPAVLQWIEIKISNLPKDNYFALLIRGLTLGDDALSNYEAGIIPILQKLNVEYQIVSEGTFAHENEGANWALAYKAACAGKKLMLFGHSMGGDEIVPIIQGLNREFVLNV